MCELFYLTGIGYDGDLFVAVVMSDGSFRLLKYKYIEVSFMNYPELFYRQ